MHATRRGGESLEPNEFEMPRAFQTQHRTAAFLSRNRSPTAIPPAVSTGPLFTRVSNICFQGPAARRQRGTALSASGRWFHLVPCELRVIQPYFSHPQRPLRHRTQQQGCAVQGSACLALRNARICGIMSTLWFPAES